MSSPTTDQQPNTDTTWKLEKGDHVVLQYSEQWRQDCKNLPHLRLVIVTKVLEGGQFYGRDLRTDLVHYVDQDNYVAWGCTMRRPTLKELRNPGKFK